MTHEPHWHLFYFIFFLVSLAVPDSRPLGLIIVAEVWHSVVVVVIDPKITII